MPKNILMILTDQQRKDSLGCYGNPVCQTPNLDRLANEGIRFERHYAANPICMPSRLSIFTGQRPASHGLWTNGLLLPHEKPTLAAELAAQGWQTASIGKIHFTPFGGEGEHRECGAYWRKSGDGFDWNGPYWGFEHVELTIGHTAALAHYGRWFRKKGGTEEMLKRRSPPNDPEAGARDIPPELHDSAFVAERACRFLKNRNRAKPFLLAASFPDPHHPFDPPRDTAEKYLGGEVIPPDGSPEDLETRPPRYKAHFRGEWSRAGPKKASHPDGLSKEQTRNRIALTYAMAGLIDQNIGKILGTLKKENLLENTIVVFTTDHGELLGDHGLWAKGPFFYESLINTPLIISAPGFRDGRVSQALFSDLDLVPTLCDLAGAPVPFYADGKSQLPHFENPQKTVRDGCLTEYRNGYGEQDCAAAVLTTRDWKYVRSQTGEEELADLKNDPLEKENIAAKAPAQTRAMRDRLLDELLSTQCKWPDQISHA